MHKVQLLASCAVVGFVTSAATPIIAQDVNQTANNSADISLPNSTGITVGGNINGIAGSATANATGAVASVVVEAVNTQFIGDTFGTIDQSANNSGLVDLRQEVMPLIVDVNGNLAGAGTNASVAASGTVTSVSFTGVNASQPGPFSPSVTGDITQTSIQRHDVLNGGFISSDPPDPPLGVSNFVEVDGIGGDGASAALSSTGAAASVSGTFINSRGTDFNDLRTGDINQTARVTSGENQIKVQGSVRGLNQNISGDGASASVTATGAVTSASASFIDSAGSARLGGITQTTTNDSSAGVLNNSGAIAGDQNNGFTISGAGASASFSSTGVASSVLLSAIKSIIDLGFGAGPIEQTTRITSSRAGVVNNGDFVDMDGVSGSGASASIGATGAVSAVSLVNIEGAGSGVGTSIGSVNQTTTTNLVDANETRIDSYVRNTGDVRRSLSGGVTGDGASVSISATGAVSSVAGTFINSLAGGALNTDVGNITQTTTNIATGGISNRADFSPSNAVIGPVSGDGASVSISTTGAASSVSLNSINSHEIDRLSFGSITQTTSNQATISNFNESGLTVGPVSGDGASVSASATGAVSAVSLSSINGVNINGVVPTILVGSISQNTRNTAPVTNTGPNPGPNPGSSIDAGNLAGSGDGASVSVSTSGAVSSVASTRINSTDNGQLRIRSIDQVSTNTGDILNNVEQITAGNLGGDGSSVSASAVGAIAAVSLASINSDSPGRAFIRVGNVEQTATNRADVTNTTNTLNAGNLSGDGASVSASATGAASSLSVSRVNSTEIGRLSIGNITQVSSNTGPITNTVMSPVIARAIQGNGASVSVASSGAISSASITSIDNVNSGLGAPTIAAAAIIQRAVNTGPVTNSGSISVGNISGKGASVSLGATGASATLAVTRINSGQGGGSASAASVTQTAINSGTVINSGSISTGAITGNGATTSMGATGAAAGISFSSIN